MAHGSRRKAHGIRIEEKGVGYRLAPGAQVREEDFGLLFYTMHGPRLFFLSCGDLLKCDFFESRLTLEEWFERCHEGVQVSKIKLPEIRKTLQQLKEKGVILER